MKDEKKHIKALAEPFKELMNHIATGTSRLKQNFNKKIEKIQELEEKKRKLTEQEAAAQKAKDMARDRGAKVAKTKSFQICDVSVDDKCTALLVFHSNVATQEEISIATEAGPFLMEVKDFKLSAELQETLNSFETRFRSSAHYSGSKKRNRCTHKSVG